MKKLLQYEDLKEVGVPYSKEHLRRLTNEGQFPVPVKLSNAGRGSHKAWVASEIEEWLQSRIIERDTGEAANVSAS